jgi:RNA polymerase sigma-70 factor (ECF subfamily)
MPSAFDEMYARHFEYVQRSARWLGVVDAADDVAQQVFLVAYRRFPEFRGDAHPRSWLYAILWRVVCQHRRSLRRRHGRGPSPWTDPESVPDDPARGPDEWTARAEAARLVKACLYELDEDKREIFLQSEIEGRTAKQIADATGANPSTVYSRLRVARLDFERAAERRRRCDARQCR